MANIAIIGSSGSIGSGFINVLSQQRPNDKIFAFSRSQNSFNNPKVIHHNIDFTDEASIENAASKIEDNSLDLIIETGGILHQDNLMPEKSLKDLSFEKFEKIFAVNTIGPSLIIKNFSNKLIKEDKSVFALLSARVGSISDNQLGGWYAYRASKAALNMIIKTSSIEIKRKFPHAAIIALHPGTVDSNLSKPFQHSVAKDKLFSPIYAAEKLYEVIINIDSQNTGNFYAWDGQKIEF